MCDFILFITIYLISIHFKVVHPIWERRPDPYCYGIGVPCHSTINSFFDASDKNIRTIPCYVMAFLKTFFHLRWLCLQHKKKGISPQTIAVKSSISIQLVLHAKALIFFKKPLVEFNPPIYNILGISIRNEFPKKKKKT